MNHLLKNLSSQTAHPSHIPPKSSQKKKVDEKNAEVCLDETVFTFKYFTGVESRKNFLFSVCRVKFNDCCLTFSCKEIKSITIKANNEERREIKMKNVTN